MKEHDLLQNLFLNKKIIGTWEIFFIPWVFFYVESSTVCLKFYLCGSGFESESVLWIWIHTWKWFNFCFNSGFGIFYVFNFKSITLVGIRIRIHSGKNVMNGRLTFRDSMRLKSTVSKTDPIWTRIHNCSRTLLVVPVLLSQSQDFLSHERLYVLG